MKLEIYQNTAAFGADALEILLENEVQNNLPISFINRVDAPPDWLLATVKDENGGIALVAAMTPPFNITLYETRNTPNDAAVKFLSDELKSMGTALPGVNAESGLARRFAQARGGEFETHISMNVMRLDSVNDIPEVSGHCRLLREEDLFFAPYWAYHFGLDCGVEVYDIPV
ncbi:MAG: hypothetical protein LBN99_07425, partial [Oscillospiraceae bacterium]|nr:hypothetical protein [Oscillospiraceae bacterium]